MKIEKRTKVIPLKPEHVTVPEKNVAIDVLSPFNGRVIGIVHRIKQTKDHEARPTLVAINDQNSDAIQYHKLETEQDELDFLNGHCAVKWRDCALDDDISAFPEHQVIFRAAKDGDALIERHQLQCHYETKRGKKGAPDVKTLIEVASKVPTHWIGIQRDDTVAMTLGGSGDYFAYALSRKLSEMNGQVLRIPPFKLKEARGSDSKDVDPLLLVNLAKERRGEFYETRVRDRGIIKLRNVYRDWMDTMKARIACEQRLARRHMGMMFCSEAGKFPEGSLINSFEERKTNDGVLLALQAEEAEREKDLKKAIANVDVWDGVFENIPGLGPKIAARLVSSVIDIRRFKKASQFVKFLGVHVILKDDKGQDLPRNRQFPRHREGHNCNWSPDGRQALYLLADQFVRQSVKTEWGRYLIARKAALRVKHPEVVIENGKKRYTNGHIHKMAVWRTLTRFAERLHRDWWKLEESAAKASSKE